ncbi:MAG TPA: ribokinase [Vitreimonas sp.]|nr:ribokinase [Vitreimonas sp.]
MPGRVIVVGSVNIDLVVSTARLPAPGETVTGGSFDRHDGGKGGNQATAAARLAAPTAIIGAVGDDAFGEQARAALERDGVDVTALEVRPGEATGVALIIVADGGENVIAVASGANASVDAPAVEAALTRLSPEPADVVLVGHEIPTRAARQALRVARASGAMTVLNPAPAQGLDRSVFGLADVLTPNRGELEALVVAEAARLGRPAWPAADLARAARSLAEPSAEGPGAGAVIVSLGAMGALLVRPGEAVQLPAPTVEAVDATGAGDALNGALAAGLALGLDLRAAAARAVVAASLSTMTRGARDGLPRPAAVDRAAAPDPA